MGQSLLEQAFEGKNKRIPVWFMRQAGRFLPEYRKIREKYSLGEMFRNPEIAAEVTCQPVDILGVDAAILFADILTLPAAMGFDVEFTPNNGPVIKNPIRTVRDLKKIHDLEGLEYLSKTIQIVNGELTKNVPLIGFAGSPFTVACYLIEGGSSSGFVKTLQLMHGAPAVFTSLMEKLTENTIEYLKLQKTAGAKVYQVFDSWAGILRAADYAHFVLPHLKKIFKEVKFPSIYYIRGAGHLLALADQLEADFLSVCHEVVLGHNPVLEKTKKGVQGNLFNGLFYADKKVLEKEINDVLLGARHYTRYIFNAGHGLLPDTDVEKVKLTIDVVRRFSWPVKGK